MGKNHPQYQFSQNLSVLSVNPAQGQYSFAVQPMQTAPGGRPPIGPSIGPDPRNSVVQLKLLPHPSFEIGNGIRCDFNHGFRIETPPGNREYRLRVSDLDSMVQLVEMHLKGGQLAVGDRKYFIRYRVEVFDANTKELLASHDYDCDGKNVMVVIPDGGLGDNLAWLPYAEAFRVEHRAKVTCVCGEWLIRLVRDQYPEMEFQPAADPPSSQNYYASYCCAIFREDRKSWRPSDHQHFGMQGSIAQILGVKLVPRKVRFKLNSERPFPEPFVCISTMATNPAKYWNFPDGWNILCRYLKSLGYRVLVLDRDHQLTFSGKTYTVPEEAEDFTGLKPISERIALLQHADFFIGLPSGLSWLAWNCNVPVVMLAGFTMDGSEFPTPYRVYNQNFCHGCWNDSTCFFDMKVPVWCPKQLGTPHEIECTRVITPKMVIETVNRIPSVRKKIWPKVTFAVPVYNPPAPLFRAMLDSVIRQAEAYGNAEFILQDDGSPDPAVKVILEEYRDKYPSLVSFECSPKNEGLITARKRLLDRAAGRYMVLFDNDDIMLPFDLDRIIRKMEQDPELLCCYGKKWFFNQNGPVTERHGWPFSSFLSLFSMIQLQNGSVFRTDILRSCKVYDDVLPVFKYKDDVMLFSRIALHGRCECDSGYRSLALQHKAYQDDTTHEDYVANVCRLVEPYKAVFEKLEKGIFPENAGNLPLAALAGGAFFIHQKERDVAEKILAESKKRFPKDPGVRGCALQWAAGYGSVPDFREEWNRILADFSSEDDLFFILSRAVNAARQRNLLTLEQEAFYRELHTRQHRTPGCVLDAWRESLSSVRI